MASFNINDFLAEVNDKGILRTNKFLCRFPVPIALFQKSQNALGTARILELWCESATIPGLILATHNVPRYGYGAQENKPFLQQTQNANFSLISDGNAENWRFFYDWMNLILNTKLVEGIHTDTNTPAVYEVGYKFEYASDVEVLVYNDNQDVVLHTVLQEAYPVFIGEVNLHWGEKGNLVRFPVTFTYQSWHLSDVNE